MTFAHGSRARALPAAALMTLVLLVSSHSPAHAEPTDPLDHGESPSLTAALEAASRGYTDAKAKLEQSERNQAALTIQAAENQTRVTDLSRQLSHLAAGTYRGSGTSTYSALMSAQSFGAYLDKASIVEQLSWQNGRKLRELRDAKRKLEEQRKAVDREKATQVAQRDEMAAKKAAAEKALGLTGPGSTDSGVTGDIPVARAAPRSAEGRFAKESCSGDDPTTGGCITPRTLHAFLEARSAGFQRHTACTRASSGEHGKGRACDFASSASGFAGAATGGDRLYGNRLAAFFVRNADRLGVLYVIWYRRIWMPGVGWAPYDGRGSAATEHTNHVHLSVQ